MKTGNVLRSLLLLFVAVVALTACGGEDPAKVGLLLGDSSQDRWAQDEAIFVAKVNELGAEALVRESSNDPAKQVEQARELVKEGVDVIVILPSDANAASEVVKVAHEAGIKVLAYDRIIKDCPLDYYISFDNVRVGELQAEYALSVEPKGRYLVLAGPTSDNNSMLFKQGQMATLKPKVEAGDIEVLDVIHTTEWSGEEAYDLAKEALVKYDSLDVIIAANDDQAAGVRRALSEAGLLGVVKVTGQDADLEACRAIIRGDQIMTVYKPIRAIANTAALTAVSLALQNSADGLDGRVDNGQREVPSILLEPIKVDQDNMRANIVADEFHSEAELYNE